MQQETIQLTPATRFMFRGIKAEELQKNVFRIDTEGGVVTYYAKSERWQHRGKVYSGTIRQLQVWLKEKGLYSEKSAL